MREELIDGNIKIRRFVEGDVDAVFEAVSESIPEVHRWADWCHPDYTRDESVEWVETSISRWNNDEEYHFVIEEVPTGVFLGGCGFNGISKEYLLANMGYWVRSSRAGRGKITAGARLAVRFGFEDLGLQRIEIVTDVDNAASRRVAEKIGAVFEGRVRNRVRYHNKQRDGALYSIIPDDVKNV